MSEADNAVLKYFAYNYESFIEDVFPLLNTQLSLLEEAMIYVIEQDSAVEINTLDKCILRYDYGHMVTEKRSFWNPILKKPSKYSLNFYDKSRVGEARKKRAKRHRLSFRANLVHSIDGAIMRQFITKFYESTRK